MPTLRRTEQSRLMCLLLCLFLFFETYSVMARFTETTIVKNMKKMTISRWQFQPQSRQGSHFQCIIAPHKADTPIVRSESANAWWRKKTVVAGSPPANLGVFSNGKWTPVDEQCHTAVHERVKRGLWPTILFMEGLKKTFMNDRSLKSEKTRSWTVKKPTPPTISLVEWVFYLFMNDAMLLFMNDAMLLFMKIENK